MHPEAMTFLKGDVGALAERSISVLEIGARDINGSPRELFSDPLRYVGLDIEPGDGVDIVADAATWKSEERFDLVICAEVFEHAPRWRDICQTAYDHLKEDGIFLGTAAGGGRRAHSAVDGEHLLMWRNEAGLAVGSPDVKPEVVDVVNPDGLEYYCNIEWDELQLALAEAGFLVYTLSENRGHGDIYWCAEKLWPDGFGDIPDVVLSHAQDNLA